MSFPSDSCDNLRQTRAVLPRPRPPRHQVLHRRPILRWVEEASYAAGFEKAVIHLTNNLRHLLHANRHAYQTPNTNPATATATSKRFPPGITLPAPPPKFIFRPLFVPGILLRPITHWLFRSPSKAIGKVQGPKLPRLRRYDLSRYGIGIVVGFCGDGERTVNPLVQHNDIIPTASCRSLFCWSHVSDA
jgi:hypothetical protein